MRPTLPLTPPLASKLPNVGTTIFSVMSSLAAEHGAINLGQGFPDFPCDRHLISQVHAAMLADENQYPPMPGVPELRDAVSAKILALHGRHYDPGREVTITAGATQAILTAILAIVRPGDEVIVLEPCYDSYAPSVELAGGTVVRVPLSPATLRPNFDWLEAAITGNTRAIVINSPHNPGAMVWSRTEMLQLQNMLSATDIFLISDEVYEHMVYDGRDHESAVRFDDLAARAFVISSFGKTFHVTGWKVGYVVAPAVLMDEFRKVHQFNVFTVNTPMQSGIARYLQEPHHYAELPAFYQRKRDLFRAGLQETKFDVLASEGSYFQCVGISRVTDMPSDQFCRWLTTEIGVAALPLSAFYGDGADPKIIRFCFGKKDDTLTGALARLAKL